MFLRIRPVPDRDRCKAVARPMPGKDPRRKPKQAAGGDLCLVPTGPNSVALTVPQSKLVDPKRGRTEVFDGFSAVFPPDSTQVPFPFHLHLSHSSLSNAASVVQTHISVPATTA